MDLQLADRVAIVTGASRGLEPSLRKIPAGRMGEPSVLGPLTCYLVSPLSDFVTGATFVIDGGELAKL